MDENQDNETFEPLRKLLALKRYEHPRAEFRSEFMVEFRKRRLAEEEKGRHWTQRLWIWLTPSPIDWALRAGAVASVALIIANLMVLQRNHQIQSESNLKTTMSSISEPKNSPLEVVANTEPPPIITPEEEEVAMTEVYYQINDFYVQAATILGVQNDPTSVNWATPAGFTTFDPAP
jgi:hypothetical protein